METYEQQYIDLTEGGTYVAIPKTSKGHLHLTHPNSQFKLLLDKEELWLFLESAKPFSECNFNDDYIILQMMQHEETGGTLVEFLKFRNLHGRDSSPTGFDFQRWTPMRREKPAEGQLVIVYKGRYVNGEKEFLSISEGEYHKDYSHMNKNHESEEVFWKPLSMPDDFPFI